MTPLRRTAAWLAEWWEILRLVLAPDRLEAPDSQTITDPTAYHRLRINEALAFDGPLDAIHNLGGAITDLERLLEPDAVPIRTLRRVQGQLYAVRDLCAEGDRT